MKTALLIFVITLTSLVPAQGGRFSKEGLSFDYPAAWRLEEGGDAQVQRLTLTPAGASNIILIFAQREPVKTAAQLFEARAKVTVPYVTNIAHKLGLNRPPNEEQCLTVGGRTAAGFRMSGLLEGEPTTAEIYTVVLGQRLLHLVHVRNDKDEAPGAAAWKTLLDTLKVEGPAEAPSEGEQVKQIVAAGVLNGNVIKKPQPRYPQDAKAARAQGTVMVRIVVDEAGNVASAQAISGHQLLRSASEDAARRAKFQPVTLCGQPVKVSGVITYNFVIM